MLEFSKGWRSEYGSSLVNILILGITVLVVAIPEGLPLAVTISLAHSVKKMLAESNLVRALASCETMGNATTVCSDKTGTLTQNRMTVVKAHVAGASHDVRDDADSIRALPAALRARIAEHAAVNSHPKSRYATEELGGADGETRIVQMGNKTECALLHFADRIDDDGQAFAARREAAAPRQAAQFNFDHVKKRMTTVVALEGGGHRVYCKDAAEIVLARCTTQDAADGSVAPLTEADRAALVADVIEQYARDALRVILVAYRDVPAGTALDDDEALVQELTLSCLVGIQDPERPEVPEAVRRCRAAGVVVRMVTGDNKATARAIAINCGIIEADAGEDAVMEGPEFRRRVVMADGELDYAEIGRIYPALRVMARCSPSDKYNLVKGLIRHQEVVAVTGDGTNDAPALSEADVGFSMGTGTQVAREASDIVLLNDNFASLVRAISWGRNVYDGISKFLVFQLTVNVVAVVFSFIGPLTSGTFPLRATQMLWVNLLMDTLAALALATESPSDSLMDRKPYPRSQSLVSKQMALAILGHSLYQLVWMFIIYYAGEDIFDVPNGRSDDECSEATVHLTMVFNTFVALQLFNQLNARKIHGERNILTGLLARSNWMFLLIISIEWVGQAVIVEGIGAAPEAFYTVPLNWWQWLVCIGIGASELVFHQVLLFVPPEVVPDIFCNLFNVTLEEDGDAPKHVPIGHSEEADEPGVAAKTTQWLMGGDRVKNQLQTVSAAPTLAQRECWGQIEGRANRLTLTATPVELRPQTSALAPAQLWQVSANRVRQQLRVARAFSIEPPAEEDEAPAVGASGRKYTASVV